VISRITSRTVTTIGLIALALPVVALFWYIHHYSVNMVFADQWHDLGIIERSKAGTLTFGDLWAQHGENRILVPNLVVLLLAHTVHFDVVYEDYLSGLLLTAAAAFVICAHHRRSPSIPWLYYLPAAAVLLSLNQGTMILWGFALSWYAVIGALAVAIYLLDRPTLNTPVLVGAIVATVAGSFSSLEGLLIWPVGLLVLYHRSRSRGVFIVWIGAAVATTIAYFAGFNTADTLGNWSYVFHHPLDVIRFFFFAIGNVAGVAIPATPSLADYGLLVVGVVVFGIACWVLVVGLRRPVEPTGSTMGVALVLFGLVYTVTLAVGRTSFGLPALPRYAIFDLVLLAGCYLFMLDGIVATVRKLRPSRSVPDVGPSDAMDHSRSGSLRQPQELLRRGSGDHRGVQLLLVIVIVIQVVVGTYEGVSAARIWHSQEIVTADVTVNADKAPDLMVQNNLDPFFVSAPSLRAQARLARADHLSLFATGEVAYYEKVGLLIPRTPPETTVLTPLAGATLRGVPTLGAVASEPYGVTKVIFVLTGGGFHNTPIGKATPAFPFGWMLRWVTASVANGTYTIHSIAYDSVGTSGESSGVMVTVRN
jgi:hypothetical protein